MSKTIVIGLDGATWDVLSNLATNGEIPNIKKLMDNSIYGILKSTIPPVTGPAWVSFATGTNPGKHGCFDFILPKKTLDDVESITSKNINGTTYYESLDAHGKKCIIVNLPVSYPPRINCPMITSLMTKGNNCIFPPNLSKYIPELNEYRIVPDSSLLLGDKVNEYINDIIDLEKTRFKCIQKLIDCEWDFFYTLFSATDWVQHVMYDKIKSSNKLQNSNAIDIYRQIDCQIGWYINNVPPNTNIIIMSDHGFKVYAGIFFINEWLKREGYLKTKKQDSEKVYSHKLEANLESAKSKRHTIKLPISVIKYFAEINKKIPLYAPYMLIKKIFGVELLDELNKIKPDIDKSIAISLTTESRGIYINRCNEFIDSAEQYEEIRTALITKLSQLKNPINKSTKLFKSVRRKEDVYTGLCLNKAPDIIIELDDYILSTDFVPTLFENKSTSLANNHDPNGIFLAHGPDIKQGANIEGARIIDLAPTILHMYGVPIPRDMDGRVLTEIFREDSEMAQREIVYEEDKTKAEKNKDTLKNKIGKLKTKRKI